MAVPVGFHHSPESRQRMSSAHKGKPQTDEHRAKRAAAQTGEGNHRWKGGLRKHGAYLLALCPNHPYADNKGYVPQHRLVMEAHIGRPLLPTEVIHHINGIGSDNRIENLMLFPGRGSHTNYHKKMTAQGEA